jgi:DNA-binding CsgD family transcriptional regulator
MKRLLDTIVHDILQEIPPQELGELQHQRTLQNICNKYSCFVVITRLPTMLPVFICEQGLAFAGIKPDSYNQMGMKFFTKVLHPDNLSIIGAGLAHFTGRAKDDFNHSYKVKTAHKGWQWVYGWSRAINFSTDTNADYIISLIFDIEQTLENANGSAHDVTSGNGDSRQYLARLNLLSNREKEVLRLLSNGYTDERIARELSISKHTSHSHRKAIYKKLSVDNVAEAVKYAHYLKV